MASDTTNTTTTTIHDDESDNNHNLRSREQHNSEEDINVIISKLIDRIDVVEKQDTVTRSIEIERNEEQQTTTSATSVANGFIIGAGN